MHTRRIASFILGAWIAGSLLMVFISMETPHSVDALLSSPAPGAAKILNGADKDQAALLLLHAAHEQTRALLAFWQKAQLMLGIALGGFLLLATQRRILPLVLCVAMLVMVAFQYLGVSPELTSLGRLTDFPPGNASLGTRTRQLALDEVYYAAEIIKLAAGVILAGYLFVFRARRGRKETALDSFDPRAVGR